MNTIKHRAENLNNGGSVTVYYCGYEKCEGGHFWGPAVRNQYLLHYIISGKGTYTVGEETYTLHANECFLIRPGERTYYIADREDPWEYMWVALMYWRSCAARALSANTQQSLKTATSLSATCTR